MLPSTVLDITLPMFEVLTVQGPQNAKTLSKIYDNLVELRKALVRIEKEFNSSDEYANLRKALAETESGKETDNANRDEQE